MSASQQSPEQPQKPQHQQPGRYHKQLIVNSVPGEECRIALIEDGRLEEYSTERESNELHVGNIYLGRIINVEAAIQAAFVDFGVGRNGFLHLSDLHPMYFPGEYHEETEAVGQKTPHRQRPPIQHCLKRGQEIMVQVLKEGIGTKGPTLTSYLSIPGRFLVMMPNMEQLGVSRKVEDPDQRREMRQILDSMDLPDGFGFILRTAGLTANKTELKRDLAYLQRLWKNIEAPRRHVKAPAVLFTESDLLIRTIRDLATSDIDRIVIDDPCALARAQEFMQIVAPRRKTPEITWHDDRLPIFHRYAVEEQIHAIHQRQVTLPGGGSLVIDSAEAMVVIDVNSGKMRQYRDAETTAYKTNLQAVDEICRQLRLRDLGGLIVLDLIDMIHSDHRRDIENRLRDNLKRDRAKTEFLRISPFGLVEMTRQRMRPPHRKAQFTPCPTCEGRGQLQTPETTAAQAVRQLAYWIEHPRVYTVEMVVNSNVAGVMLSRKRRQIVAIENDTGKHIEVRISPTMQGDRVDFYAYDEHNSDLDLEKLAETFPKAITRISKPPTVAAGLTSSSESFDAPSGPTHNGRMTYAPASADLIMEQFQTDADEEENAAATAESDLTMSEGESADENDGPVNGSGEPRRKRRRRRSRRGGGNAGRGRQDGPPQSSMSPFPSAPSSEPEHEAGDPDPEAAPGASSSMGQTAGDHPGGIKKKRRRRSRRGGGGNAGARPATSAPEDSPNMRSGDRSHALPETQSAAGRQRSTASGQESPHPAQKADAGPERGLDQHQNGESHTPARKKRHRRRGGNDNRSETNNTPAAHEKEGVIHQGPPATGATIAVAESAVGTPGPVTSGEPGYRKKRSRGGRGRGGKDRHPGSQESPPAAGGSAATGPQQAQRKQENVPEVKTTQAVSSPGKPPRRLYGSRRRLSPGELAKAGAGGGGDGDE